MTASERGANNSAMKTPHHSTPSFEQAIEDLGEVMSLIITALRSGIRRSTGFFSDERQPIDRVLFPALVRYFAKQHLTAVDHLAIEEDSDNGEQADGLGVPEERADYGFQALSNNGLCVKTQRYRIRILKSKGNGSIPDPGSSQAMIRFCQQERQIPLPLDGMDLESAEVNIFLLWEVDPDSYMLSSVWVACPRRYSRSTRSVLCHWRRKVELPTAPTIVPPAYRRRHQTQQVSDLNQVIRDVEVKLRAND